MSDKKLQKLSYYAVAWGWALFNRPIVHNDRFEAWVHGPVSPQLYQEYREHGWNKIAAPVKEAHAFDEEMTNLLESVWAIYGDKSGNELEALTHTEAPWQAARIGLHPDDACHNVISPQTMRQFYLSIYSGD